MMNKKAFTLMELLLVVAIVAIFAASSIPFLMNSFGGFNQITNQEAIINRLQEVSTVIIRRVTFDNHSTNDLQTIIDEMQTNNGITVTLKKVEHLKDKTGNSLGIAAITLTATKGTDTHEVRFLISPDTAE